MDYKIYKDTKERLNSLILVLFIFLPIITFPINKNIGNGKVMWFLLGILVLSSLLINRTINKKLAVIMYIITIMYLINMLLVKDKSDIIYRYLMFIRYGAIAMYLSLLKINYKMVIKYWNIMSSISFIIMNLYISYFQQTKGYMDLGINLTYVFIGFILYFYTYNKNIITWLLIFITLIEVIVLGNRSSAVICIIILLYFIINNIDYKNLYRKMIKSLIIIATMISAYIYMPYILKCLSYILSKLNIVSYSITKFINTLNTGGINGIIEQSSGRGEIYKLSFDLIQSVNFMPRGVGYFTEKTGIIYPHNIFIQVMIEYGIIGEILFITILILLFVKFLKLRNKNLYFNNIVITLAIYSLIRLLFSGNYWEESVFWITFSMVIGKSKNDI